MYVMDGKPCTRRALHKVYKNTAKGNARNFTSWLLDMKCMGYVMEVVA